MTRWLCRPDGGIHAYTSDEKYFFRPGAGVWAWRSGDWLVAFEGSEPIGWFDDGVVKGVDGVVLYRFR